jgi:hypothetical protein
MDERRFGPHPILPRVWSPPGELPVTVVEPRYQGPHVGYHATEFRPKLGAMRIRWRSSFEFARGRGARRTAEWPGDDGSPSS